MSEQPVGSFENNSAVSVVDDYEDELEVQRAQAALSAVDEHDCDEPLCKHLAYVVEDYDHIPDPGLIPALFARSWTEEQVQQAFGEQASLFLNFQALAYERDDGVDQAELNDWFRSPDQDSRYDAGEYLYGCLIEELVDKALAQFSAQARVSASDAHSGPSSTMVFAEKDVDAVSLWFENQVEEFLRGIKRLEAIGAS